MKRSHLLLALACLVTTLTGMAQQNKRPNIVFIFSDDHAFQAISAYGTPIGKLAPTPNIDRIAREGMRFDRCYVTNSLCTPARATVLTGTHSHINGVRILSDSLDRNSVTFPRILHDKGYQTAIVGKWHLKTDPVGFDYWEVVPGQGEYYNPDFITTAGTHRETGYATDLITDKALAWLDSRINKDQPFLLMINNKAPHRPFARGPKTYGLYEDVTFPEPSNLFDDYAGRSTAAKQQTMSIAKDMTVDRDLKVQVTNQGVGPFYKRLTPEQKKAWMDFYNPIREDFIKRNPQGDDLTHWKYQRYMRDYLATVRSVDDNVGRVLEYLDAHGLTENTLIIYSSDQGFYLGEHGWFDKRFMYEESYRTPLVMRWPHHIKPGSVNIDLVSNLDFAQTFLAATKSPAPASMQGLSLLPVMEGKTPSTWRKSLYYHYYDDPSEHSVKVHEGVETKDYKLIHYYQLNEWELFDLKKDPHEMKSVYNDPAYAKIQKDLEAELIRLKKQYKAEHSTDPLPKQKKNQNKA